LLDVVSSVDDPSLGTLALDSGLDWLPMSVAPICWLAESVPPYEAVPAATATMPPARVTVPTVAAALPTRTLRRTTGLRLTFAP
jgi:hypothetical protein